MGGDVRFLTQGRKDAKGSGVFGKGLDSGWIVC